jgi:hypothetical protein
MREYEVLQASVARINAQIKDCHIEAHTHKELYKLTNLPIIKTFYGNFLQCITVLNNYVIMIKQYQKMIEKKEVNND